MCIINSNQHLRLISTSEKIYTEKVFTLAYIISIWTWQFFADVDVFEQKRYQFEQILYWAIWFEGVKGKNNPLYRTNVPFSLPSVHAHCRNRLFPCWHTGCSPLSADFSQRKVFLSCPAIPHKTKSNPAQKFQIHSVVFIISKNGIYKVSYWSLPWSFRWRVGYSFWGSWSQCWSWPLGTPRIDSRQSMPPPRYWPSPPPATRQPHAAERRKTREPTACRTKHIQ